MTTLRGSAHTAICLSRHCRLWSAVHSSVRSAPSHRQQQNGDLAAGDEQRSICAAHVFRLHSNGCNRDDNRQPRRAVQRDLRVLQALEYMPSVRAALCATCHINRTATNEKNGEDEDEQPDRVSGNR
jgi:hypothetical protein